MVIPTYEFSRGIEEVVTALLEAGLTLTALKEYQYHFFSFLLAAESILCQSGIAAGSGRL